jgi:Isocitrate lyase family
MKSDRTLGELPLSPGFRGYEVLNTRGVFRIWFHEYNVRDYPYTTVPNQVHRLFRAQQLHDRKHYDARLEASPQERAKMPYIDYLRPIIADADTG